VRRLFETEVAEIADKTVEIKGIAREAGHRTKIAVWSANDKVDPVGACVGMRGARVKNIVRELNNEKVDIIRWSTDTKELVLEALKPAKVKSIVLDEAKHNVLIKVEADQLSLAIGKRGQNARLTSRLTGWDISIERDESAREAFEQNVAKGVDSLASALSVSVDIARKLMDAGMVSADVIMMAEPSDIADAIGCDVATAEEIYNAARTNLSKSAS
jgi:N utilization substance protein A